MEFAHEEHSTWSGLNCIRKIDVFTQGRFSFSIDAFNFKNYMRRLRGDQAKLVSTLAGLSGYGLDMPPVNETTGEGSAQNFRRQRLGYSRDWALKSPLNIWPFIDAGVNSLVHSDTEIAIEIFFEVIVISLKTRFFPAIHNSEFRLLLVSQ